MAPGRGWPSRDLIGRERWIATCAWLSSMMQPACSRIFGPLLRSILSRYMADSKAMERRVQFSNAAWTIVRPPRLQDNGVARGYRIAVDGRPRGASAMQRADLAAFLLDEAKRAEHVKEVVGITAASAPLIGTSDRPHPRL
jgi:NAD(P)H-binding